MDNNDNKTPRKTRDVSTQTDEDNLWDLDDEWADDDNPGQEETDGADASEEAASESEDKQEETPEEQEAEVTEKPTEEEADDPAEDEETDEEGEEDPLPELEDDFDEKPETEAPISLSEEMDESADDSPSEENDDIKDVATSESAGSLTAPATVALKKLSLNKTEKIALSVIAAVLVGLGIWGCVWLSQKNEIANTRETIELPVNGKHATITDLSTIWVTPKKGPGVHLAAVVVPSISITLDTDKSGSGALRLFFKNGEGISVGDPITLPFNNGQFANDSNTIEVSASDGFREEGQFYGYQADDAVPWRVHILEAPSESSPGSDFLDLLEAPVEAKRK